MSEISEGKRQLGFVTLDSIIRSALMDIGAGLERYEQFKHWSLIGYKDFHMDLAQEVKTVQLSLTAWKAVQLPNDYVDFVALGVVVDNRIRVFTSDDRISLYRTDSDHDGEIDALVTTEQPTIQDSVPFWFWNNRNANGEDVGQLYGLTVKDNGTGYYKINTERREIQFSPAVDGNTLIYLEYISDGVNPCEKTVVNVYAASLIRQFIHWQRLQYSKSANQAQIERARKEYYNEYSKVQSRLCKITVDDVLECARNSYRLIDSI